MASSMSRTGGGPRWFVFCPSWLSLGEPPGGQRAAVGGERVGGSRGGQGQGDGPAGWQRGQRLPGCSGTGEGLAAVAGQDHGGRAAGAEGYRCWVRAAEPEGGESLHCWPSLVQAASRLADGPVPAWSRATSPLAVRLSRRTRTGCRASEAGSPGPAWCHVPPA